MSQEISPRAYGMRSSATFWEEIWEAGPYYDRVSELLDQSKHYAIFVGWQIDSRLPLHSNGRPPESLKAKILRLCDEKPDFHAYFLMWDHAYFYMMERELGQGRIWAKIHPRVHFVFDNRHPFGGSHHEKICLIDGKFAFCGGIDLCDERWDSPQHLYQDPRRSLDGRREHHGPYHDLAVQVGGPVCAEIQRHVAQRWTPLSPDPFPEPERFQPQPRGHEILLSRTQASIDGNHPRHFNEVEFLFRDLIRQAEHRILLEGQYFWSHQLNDLLIARMMERKGTPFEVTLILTDLERAPSLTSMMAGHEKNLIAQLAHVARATGCKFRAGAPYVRPPAGTTGLPSRPIYVHSKVLLIDDRYLSIGSANFAARALRLDTELQLTLVATTELEQARLRRIARSIESHWNIEKNPERPIRLLPLHWEARASAFGTLSRSSLLESLFDPESPWIEPFKKALGAWKCEKPGTLALLTLPCVALSLAAAVGLLVLSPNSTASWAVPLLFAGLGANWLLPLPFLPFLLALATLAPEEALPALVASLWLNAGVGYAFARVFPTHAAFIQGIPAGDAAAGLATERSLGGTLRLVLDPRLRLSKKIALQGIRFVPLPWFVLGTGLLLPAAFTIVLLCWEALIR